MHDLVNLDAPGEAKYLRALAVKLQTVATNLTYLAANADLTDTAENLKVDAPAHVSSVLVRTQARRPDARGSDTGVGRTAAAQVTDTVTTHESANALAGKTADTSSISNQVADELLDMLDGPTISQPTPSRSQLRGEGGA